MKNKVPDRRGLVIYYHLAVRDINGNVTIRYKSESSQPATVLQWLCYSVDPPVRFSNEVTENSGPM